MTWKRLVRVAALATLATALAGCATGERGGDATGTTLSLRDQAAPVYRDLAQCIRAHGYPGFPDPVISDDGTADIPEEAQRELNRLEATIRPACEHIMRRLPAALQDKGGRDGEEPQATPAQIAERRRFAACVRQHGVPTFPDPDASGVIRLSDRPDGPVFMDRATVRAVEECGGSPGGDLKRGLNDLGVR